jgi:hypothetical protein
MSVVRGLGTLLAAVICAAGSGLGHAGGDEGSPDPFPPVKLHDIAVTVLPVSGAPGNGNQCLQNAMQTALRERGVRVSGGPAQSLYTIEGEAHFTWKDEAWTHAVVRWTVRSPSRQEFKRSIGTGIELLATALQKEFCDKALAIASNSAYSVLEAAGVILPEDVQSALRDGHDESNGRDEWAERNERLRSETRALFAAIWQDTRRPARCELDIKWFHYPIPEGSAAKWLGVHVHADLEFTEAIKFDFQDTIAPNDIFSGAFCEDTSFREYKRSLDGALQEKGPASVPSSPDGTPGVYRREYSFPVFNEDFTRAVLTFSHGFFNVGEYHGIGITVGGLLYVKDNGAWRKQDEESFAHAE